MFNKMSVFSGTNYWSEVFRIIGHLFSKNPQNGSDIKQYENMFKDVIKSSHIYSFATGRMALYTALKTFDLGNDAEIILPSYTCKVVPSSIIYAGCRPIYCDIDKSDFNIDVSKIENLISPKTKVIYAQHTFGNMCNIEKVMEIANKYGLYVIEDVALSLGARRSANYAGTIGDIGFFSTDRSKVINTGQGGMLSLNNPQLFERFSEEYSDVPFLSKKFSRGLAVTFLLNVILHHPYIYFFGRYVYALLSRLQFFTYIDDEYPLNIARKNYPYPARLSNVLANIGVTQIDNLEGNLICRKKIAKKINKILEVYSDNYMEKSDNIFLRYSFLVRNRDYWEREFSSQVTLGIWFKTVIGGMDQNLDKVGYEHGQNPYSEYCAKHVFNIPTHKNIDFKKIENLLIQLKISNDIIYEEVKL